MTEQESEVLIKLASWMLAHQKQERLWEVRKLCPECDGYGELDSGYHGCSPRCGKCAGTGYVWEERKDEM